MLSYRIWGPGGGRFHTIYGGLEEDAFIPHMGPGGGGFHTAYGGLEEEAFIPYLLMKSRTLYR